MIIFFSHVIIEISHVIFYFSRMVLQDAKGGVFGRVEMHAQKKGQTL